MILYSTHRLSSILDNKIIFKNITLSLKSKSITLLKGPNGSGKTTLLKLLAQINTASSGLLMWNVKRHFTSKTPIEHCYFMSSDSLGLLNRSSVRWIIRSYQELSNYYLPVKSILAFLKLTNSIASLVPTLSTGQEKKATLLEAILSPRVVWLLDEPTLGLDAQAQSLLRILIQRHQGRGGITIVSSHTNLDLGPKNIINMG